MIASKILVHLRVKHASKTIDIPLNKTTLKIVYIINTAVQGEQVIGFHQAYKKILSIFEKSGLQQPYIKSQSMVGLT